jgi:hypothetical protein
LVQSASAEHWTQMFLVVSHFRPVPQSAVLVQVFTHEWLAAWHVEPAAQLLSERHSTHVEEPGSQYAVGALQSTLAAHCTQVPELQIGVAAGQSVATLHDGPVTVPPPAPPAPVPPLPEVPVPRKPPVPPLPVANPPVPAPGPPSGPLDLLPNELEGLDPQASSALLAKALQTASPNSRWNKDFM